MYAVTVNQSIRSTGVYFIVMLLMQGNTPLLRALWPCDCRIDAPSANRRAESYVPLLCSPDLQCFEGIPAPYDKKKRMVVPNALQVIKMAPGRRFCVLGRLSEEVGWPHSDLIKRLEVGAYIVERTDLMSFVLARYSRVPLDVHVNSSCIACCVNLGC